MRLTRRVELQPTPTQRRAFLQHAGCARWAWNWGLQRHRETYAQWVELGKPKRWTGWKNSFDLCKELVVLKKTPPSLGGVLWMYEVSSRAPREALADLDRAFRNFLSRKAHYPKFKSRNRGIGSFRLEDAIRIDEDTGQKYSSIRVCKKSIQLPKIGRVRLKPGEHGYIPCGPYGRVSISEQSGRWYACVLLPDPIKEEAPLDGCSKVGLDLGVTRLATLSDGTFIENPKALASEQRKIKRLQKEVSRKQKGSKNRGKAKAKLARAHARVRNVRRDALHKATTTLAKSHGRIVVEDLKVRNMTRKGQGKSGLNRVVLDASFGEFRRMLEYKGKLYACGEDVRPDLRIKQISVKQESVVA